MSSKTHIHNPSRAADVPIAGATRPFRVAVTGGIGSGKSHVCRLIEARGFPVFYCDDEAKRIMRTDDHVRRALTDLIGPEAYGADGLPVKAVLASYICRGTSYAARVDAIVHPAVGRAFEAWADSRSHGPVFMECALLFEASFDRYADTTVLVAAPLETRIRRVMRRDGIAREDVLDWMRLQMSEEEKARRAASIVRNGDTDDVPAQVDALLRGWPTTTAGKGDAPTDERCR